MAFKHYGKTQQKVFKILLREYPKPVQIYDISAELDCSHQQIANMMCLFRKRKLIRSEKDPEDQSYRYYWLTYNGREIAKEVTNEKEGK